MEYKVRVLRASANDQSLTHSDRNSEGKVMIFDADAHVKFYGRLDEIPVGNGHTVVCNMCSPRKELRCRNTLIEHIGSREHRAAADFAANEAEKKFA